MKSLISSAGASLNEPPPELLKIFPHFFSFFSFSLVTVRPPIDFLKFFFSRYLQQLHTYGPLYVGVSGVTRPLHEHLRPFTTNGALLPRDGALLPSCPRVGAGRFELVCAGSANYN